MRAQPRFHAGHLSPDMQNVPFVLLLSNMHMKYSCCTFSDPGHESKTLRAMVYYLVVRSARFSHEVQKDGLLTEAECKTLMNMLDGNGISGLITQTMMRGLNAIHR